MSEGREPRIEEDAQVLLPADVRERIRSHLEDAYPEEACGGLLGRALNGRTEVTAVAALENRESQDRARRYLIDPDAVLALQKRAEEQGLEVVGYYHSHPEAPAEPSAFDREAAWPWYVYLIVSLRDGRATEFGAWRLTEDRSGFRPLTISETDSGSEKKLDTRPSPGFE